MKVLNTGPIGTAYYANEPGKRGKRVDDFYREFGFHEVTEREEDQFGEDATTTYQFIAVLSWFRDNKGYTHFNDTEYGDEDVMEITPYIENHLARFAKLKEYWDLYHNPGVFVISPDVQSTMDMLVKDYKWTSNDSSRPGHIHIPFGDLIGIQRANYSDYINVVSFMNTQYRKIAWDYMTHEWIQNSFDEWVHQETPYAQMAGDDFVGCFEIDHHHHMNDIMGWDPGMVMAHMPHSWSSEKREEFDRICMFIKDYITRAVVLKQLVVVGYGSTTK